MRFKSPIVSSSLILVFCLPLAAQVAVAPLPAPTGARVTLRGAALRADGALSGRGIEGVGAETLVDAHGRELVWKEVRREVDPEGNIHAFYRQHLAGRGVDAEVYGSEVGAHYSPDGVLRSVSGRQYRDVNVGNEVALDREAAERRFLGSSGSSEFLGANHPHAEEPRGTPRNPEDPPSAERSPAAELSEQISAADKPAPFPLRTENGVPVYKEWGDQPAWRGSAAGDALHNTSLTMAAFNAMGRRGWDNNYGEARIIIESVTPAHDQAQYNQNVTTSAPPNAVMLGRPRRMYPAGPVTYNGTNSYTFNDLLHKDDTPTLNATTHSRANKLSVVHRLLAEGGKNPVCARLPNLSGCGTTVGAIGITKANKILFNALQFYIGAYATWDDLADTIAETAFNEYDKCSVDPLWNAELEQRAVFDAFTAIGHPGSGNLNQCF